MFVPAAILASMSGCSEAQAHSVPAPEVKPPEAAPASPELVEVELEEQTKLQQLVESVATKLKPGQVEHAFGNDPCPPCGMG